MSTRVVKTASGNELQINGTAIDPTGATSNQVLAFDGTRFKPAAQSGGAHDPWWSAAKAAASGNLTVTTHTGDFSVGAKYQFTQPCTVTGVEFYYPDTTSRTIKLALWVGGSAVATKTSAYNVAGLTTVTFTSPYSVTAGNTYKDVYVTFHDTAGGSGAYWDISAGSTTVPGTVGGSQAPFQEGPAAVRVLAFFASGDNQPTTQQTGTIYPIAPLVTVP